MSPLQKARVYYKGILSDELLNSKKFEDLMTFRKEVPKETARKIAVIQGNNKPQSERSKAIFELLRVECPECLPHL